MKNSAYTGNDIRDKKGIIIQKIQLQNNKTWRILFYKEYFNVYYHRVERPFQI